MGFPFDRPTGNASHTLFDFCEDYNNMMVIDAKITFLKDNAV